MYLYIHFFVYINMYLIRIILLNCICHIDILICKLGNCMNETNWENKQVLQSQTVKICDTCQIFQMNHPFYSHSYLTNFSFNSYITISLIPIIAWCLLCVILMQYMRVKTVFHFLKKTSINMFWYLFGNFYNLGNLQYKKDKK